MTSVWNILKVYADAPAAWQMWFQDPRTSVMEGITDLNADIQFFLIVILLLVLWLRFRIVYRFIHTKQPVPERFNHHTSLELVWAILPSVIVTLIALPSLTLIFTYDDLVRKPLLTVKVIGRQWYWQYRMKESVDFYLRKETEKLLLADFESTFCARACFFTLQRIPNSAKNGNIFYLDFLLREYFLFFKEMTLDLILFRPEFFLLFGFFVLLGYGTGNVVRPVSEYFSIPQISQRNQGSDLLAPHANSANRVDFVENLSRNPDGKLRRGPNHAVSSLTLWAIFWCRLGAFLLFESPLYGIVLGGTFQKDPYSLSVCILLFRRRTLVLRVGLGWQKIRKICHTEYVYLAILALMGQYLMIQATDLMSLYICLELQSFSLVVLCGLNSKSAYSLEAAMKYFLLSAFRSCLLLLGVSFIYLQTGETNLSHIENLRKRTRLEPSLALALGIWLVRTGLLWKLRAAPLHFWVPDVYQGAWSSVSLWITVLPKISVLGFWTRHWHGIWTLYFGNALAFFRGLSMIVGAIAPLAQTNLKRLLAYSSIGHMGLILMPLCAPHANSLRNVNFSVEKILYSSSGILERNNDSLGVLWAYMILYIFMNLGVWGLIMQEIVRPAYKKYSGPQYLWDLKGLNQSSARIAWRWAVLMVSLAGIPPVYAFLGKAAIIWQSVQRNNPSLVLIALRYSLIGRVYYLKIVKICYVDNPTSWTTYGKISSLSAYIIARCVLFMLIGLWSSNILFLFTHLLALKVSFFSFFPFFFETFNLFSKKMYMSALFAPFLGSALAGLMGRWLGTRGSGFVTILGLGTSAFFSFFIFYEVLLLGSPVIVSLSSWFGAHTVTVDWLLCFDALSASMMVTVTLVSFCVHIYSMGYMQRDPHLPRFLSYLSLFTGSMLILVTANDLITLMVGWEMIGVCSYLLIGFWFHRLSRTKAAQKAMLVNRVSDTVLLVGLFLCWWYLGTTDTSLIPALRRSSDYVDWICLCLLGGALGKSAQIGLHVWLADRMEGPTPVSALIHAATLVTAGIFLIARTNSLWECSLLGRSLLLWVGAVTSLMRRSMGLVQNDVKRVIAYSTCSQLGYMVVALSLSHYGLAMYHLMTHACFKALLFLGAGVVIHASADVQDMRRSGGAHSSLPLAWTVLLIGSLSLLGWPFLAGYYSKDAILELSWRSSGSLSAYGHLILMTVACLTSAYSFRVLWAVFYAPNTAKKKNLSVPGQSLSLVVPLCILTLGSLFRGYLLSDRRIGWGTDFWGNSIFSSPRTTDAVRSHMIPVWISLLPFLTVFLGRTLAYVFVSTGPLLYCTESYWKKIYLFLRTRWGFDLVWNQQISLPILLAGRISWKSLDKGVLELLGPRGITTQRTSWGIPSFQKLQSGSVQDYALLLQILIAVGLLLLAFPGGDLRRIGFSFAKIFTLRILLCLMSLSIFSFLEFSFLKKRMISGLFLSTFVVLFRMGALGTFLNRRSFLIMLLCIEVMLLSVNMIFLTGSVTVDDLNGQLMALWVLTAAASETALGLALCVLYFRLRSTLDVELMSLMKGSVFSFFQNFSFHEFLSFLLEKRNSQKSEID